MSSRTFDLNGAGTVSMGEMEHNPLQTTKIIAEMYGWHWASRLWAYWDSTLPKFGVHECHHQSRIVRRWLDDNRPNGDDQ